MQVHQRCTCGRPGLAAPGARNEVHRHCPRLRRRPIRPRRRGHDRPLPDRCRPAGAVTANLMFHLPGRHVVDHGTLAGYLWFAEGVATLGLLLVIFGVVRSGRSAVAAFAVAGCIAGAYEFTFSTSFANPAVTIGRAFSDTFAGIEPASVPMFIVAQLVGVGAATGLVLVIYPDIGDVADRVVIPT